MLTQDQAIANLLAQYERVKTNRDIRMRRVESMRKYTFPHKSYLTSAMGAGDNAWRNLFDNLGQTAARDFAANLFTHTTPSDQTWFLLTPPASDPERYNDRSLREGLAQRTEDLHRAMAQTETHWATEIHSAFEELADGTCCMEFVKESDRESPAPFTCSCLAMNEYAFLSDAAGRPHTVFHEEPLTAYEAAKRWGTEVLSDALQRALTESKADAYVETTSYLNVMRPNETWDPKAISSRRFQYENLWLDPKTKKILQRGGMRRLRRVVARFSAARGLPFGFGPTDAAYGAIRALDKAVEVVLKYAARAMNPPSIWPDDGAFLPQDTTPGSIIVGRLGATDRGVPSFMEVSADHRIGEYVMNYLASQVSRAYMAEVFAILRDEKERTAREVATILEKSYDVMIPPLARVKQELISPSILIQLEMLTERQLGIEGWMYGGRELPDYRYDLHMISPLYLAIQYAQLQRIGDAYAVLSPWAEIDPEVWDTWKLSEISHVVQDSLGIPNQIRRSTSEVREIRRMRSEMIARQQQLAEVQVGAEATNKLTKAVEPNSPLAQLAAA